MKKPVKKAAPKKMGPDNSLESRERKNREARETAARSMKSGKKASVFSGASSKTSPSPSGSTRSATASREAARIELAYRTRENQVRASKKGKAPLKGKKY